MLAVVALPLWGSGCSEHRAPSVIAIDGSSTVYPISEAVAEEYQKHHATRVTIGVSGTGGGFKKLCHGEAALTGASRPIQMSEVQACAEAGVRYIELPIAYDGIAVVVHPDNPWVDSLTVEELRALWRPEGARQVRRWSDLRAGLPDREIHLFGPGVDSGTYDYFTAAVVGREHASRGDFTSSEDDNVLVQGVATDPLALGFFGYAYYAENAHRLKLLAVDDGNDDNGAGAITPSPETVRSGLYQPLSRPVFLYVSAAAAEREQVQTLVRYYLEQGGPLASELGYVPLPDSIYGRVLERFTARVTGSRFAGSGSRVGLGIEDLLSQR